MTQLRKRVLDELERRNYSQATAWSYVGAMRQFAAHFHRSPDQLGPEHVREYQLHLLQERKLHPRTVSVHTAALRFLFNKVLKRRLSRDDLPLPKLLRRQIPVVLSRKEVARLIDSTGNLRHRTILMTLYSTGVRRSELCRLRPDDIGRTRWVHPKCAGFFLPKTVLSEVFRGKFTEALRGLFRQNKLASMARWPGCGSLVPSRGFFRLSTFTSGWSM